MTAPDRTSSPLTELVSLGRRHAVVTGAARGLGLAVAHRLAHAGADITLVDIDADAAVGAAEQLSATSGRRAHATQANLADGDAVARLVNTVYDRAPVDIWVNNAGIYPRGAIVDTDDNQWDLVMALNVRAPFIATRTLARRLIADTRSGVIINITSTAAYNTAGGANSAAYVASKHALEGLTKSTAVELGRHGIRAVAVAPTLARTPGVQADYDKGLGEVLDAYGAQLPLGRMALPDDIARAVLFAASDLATFITGSTVVVDGGDLAA